MHFGTVGIEGRVDLVTMVSVRDSLTAETRVQLEYQARDSMA